MSEPRCSDGHKPSCTNVKPPGTLVTCSCLRCGTGPACALGRSWMTQPKYADGDWPAPSKFVWEPEDGVLLPGHIVVISTADDLIEHLGDDTQVNWPLVVVGLKRKGLIPDE